MRAGCSGTPKDNDSPASRDTDAILEDMTYVGGMNYAKYRLEACRAKSSGKQRTRPPTLCVQDERTRDGTASTTSSRRSSAYRAVEEAAAARTALLQAEAEAQRAPARQEVRTPEVEQTEVAEPIDSASKMVPMRTPNPSKILKTSPKTQPKVVIPPPTNKKATKVHVCTPNPLSDVPMPSMTSLTRTRDQGVDPMPITSSTFDLTGTRTTTGSHTSSTEDEAYATARMRTVGTNSMFLTASEGILTGKPCASCTRKKDNANGELSMQATRGSQDNSPAPSEVEEVISPE